MKKEELIIEQLGTCKIPSPLNLSFEDGDGIYNYVDTDDRILLEPNLKKVKKCLENGKELLSFEKAGPYEYIYFEPAKTKVGIVTCGGLCPGLNNVIRSLVIQLYNRYKVKKIIGFKYGYTGFVPKYNYPVIELTPEFVDDIHLVGGTILGSSRGEQDPQEIVDTLEKLNINILFTIGGDGTLRGAKSIKEEISRRNLKIAVAGIPKTIDNDINYIEKSFGFETAFTTANDILIDAHNEAKGAINGISIVKLMGRDSGFVAASAALSVPDVNYVIVPEMKFDLYGENGFLEVLKKRLIKKQHALVVIAEGAGQKLFENENKETDASGNVKYGDIGIYLKNEIHKYYTKIGFEHNIKYIDPSYIIRSVPANANDSKFCSQLAQNAVHAAMAGKTNFVVGNWNGYFTLLPISLAVKERKKINVESEFWYSVLESTGQPVSMQNKK